jgi:hypothetical protein
MKTYLASPERADEQELAAAVAFASRNPVISGLLSSVGGLMNLSHYSLNLHNTDR